MAEGLEDTIPEARSAAREAYVQHGVDGLVMLIEELVRSIDFCDRPTEIGELRRELRRRLV